MAELKKVVRLTSLDDLFWCERRRTGTRAGDCISKLPIGLAPPCKDCSQGEAVARLLREYSVEVPNDEMLASVGQDDAARGRATDVCVAGATPDVDAHVESEHEYDSNGGEDEMDENENLQIVLCEVSGWQLGRVAGADEPRVVDLELARKLGYQKPYDIRPLIERMIADGSLNKSDVFRTARKNNLCKGRPGKEYWLTRTQALKVASRSETPPADALLDEMIRVFELALDGKLLAGANTQLIVSRLGQLERAVLDTQKQTQEVAQALVPLTNEVKLLKIRPNATLSHEELSNFERLRESVAVERVHGGLNPSLRSANRWVQNLVRDTADWNGSYPMLPLDKYPSVMRALTLALREAAAAGRSRDPVLPGV